MTHPDFADISSAHSHRHRAGAELAATARLCPVCDHFDRQARAQREAMFDRLTEILAILDLADSLGRKVQPGAKMYRLPALEDIASFIETATAECEELVVVP